MKKQSRSSKWLSTNYYYLLYVAILCVFFGLASPFLASWKYYGDIFSLKEFGVIGDWLRGTSAPILGLASFLLVLAAFFAQKEELTLTREQNASFRSEVPLSDQLKNMSYFTEEYLNRQINPPVIIGKYEFVSLKDIRNELKNLYLTKPNGMELLTKNSLMSGSIPNTFAYHLSLGLQQVGILCLSGALPLKIILAMNAYQIVEDWGYCSGLVKKIREGHVLSSKSCNMGFHRRHGEWLAYAAAIYMNNNWQGSSLESVLSYYNEDIETIQKKEKEIRDLENAIIPPKTQEDIKIILGISNE